MPVLLVEPGLGLRQLCGAERWGDGDAVRAVTTWAEAAYHSPARDDEAIAPAAFLPVNGAPCMPGQLRG